MLSAPFPEEMTQMGKFFNGGSSSPSGSLCRA
jgi:hypothetical protein